MGRRPGISDTVLNICEQAVAQTACFYFNKALKMLPIKSLTLVILKAVDI